MRVFALSDIHIDDDVNAKCIANLSIAEYQDDVLILARRRERYTATA